MKFNYSKCITIGQQIFENVKFQGLLELAIATLPKTFCENIFEDGQIVCT